MNPILRNVLAIVAGWLGGSVINMGLVMAGHSIFPIEGVKPDDMEAFATIAPSLGPKYMVFPFLAHALGTLAGAYIAYTIAANRKMRFAIAIGVFFLIGGIMVNIMIPAAMWFRVTDVIVAYIPMAYLGGMIGKKFSKKEA